VLGLGAAAILGELGLRLVGLGDPVLYDNRAGYGYRPLPSQWRRRLWGAHVRINALGFRGPEVAPERPPAALRVLFLGDSVTYGGSYVDDSELFSAVAARTLARRRDRDEVVEPLNAGVNAWGPQNILGLVRHADFRQGFGSQLWVVTVADDDFRRDKTRIGEVPYFNAPPRLAWEELAVLAAYRVVTAYKRTKPAEDVRLIAHRNVLAYQASSSRRAPPGPTCSSCGTRRGRRLRERPNRTRRPCSRWPPRAASPSSISPPSTPVRRTSVACTRTGST